MNLTLNWIDVAAISPLLILLAGAITILFIESFFEIFTKKFSFPIALATIAIAMIAAIYAPDTHQELLTPWLKFDPLSHFFNIFFLAIGFGSVLLSGSFFQRFEASRGEYYFLLLSALSGILLIGSSADFLTLFLGLEALSISLYVMCGYMKKWEISHEAAMKYFLIGALAAGFLLYGIALIYGAVGTTRFDLLLPAYKGLIAPAEIALFFGGIALVTLGLAFKAALVPFHAWAPDVYSGAPMPVTAFMAVGTKAAAFAAFIRVFMEALPQFDPLWNQCAAFLVFPTLIYANIVAIRQVQLRRFFAYSGISHAGFLLIPLAVGTPDALPSLLFYLTVYAFATLGAFAVLASLDGKVEGVSISDLNGLFQRSPFLAAILTLCLLTLAGIPPTAGFFAKFYIFKLAFEAKYYALVIVALLTTIFSAFYYLRIIAVMFSRSPQDATTPSRSWPAAAVGLFSLAAIVAISIYPGPLLDWVLRASP